ncbi:MAG: outer membrane beta-barrel protein [Acidobacteriota bacterium]
MSVAGCGETAVPLCVQCFIHEKPVEEPPIVDPTEFYFLAQWREGYDAGDTDAGIAVGLGGAYHLNRRWAFGFEATYFESDSSVIDTSTTAFDLYGRYYFNADREGADWFLRAGAGWASITGATRGTLPLGGFDDTITFNAGLGADLRINERALWRPEVVGRYLEEPDEFQLSVGIALAFR